MNERERIGKRVVELRKEKGFTQEDLAEAAGIDRTNIAKIEGGKYNVSIDILSKVADVFGCSFDIVSCDEYAVLKNSRMINKAKVVFEMYDAASENINIFGDWAVNADGDIINVQMRYPIYSYQLKQEGYEGLSGLDYWVTHISLKKGFDVEHFKEAYNFAFPLAKDK